MHPVISCLDLQRRISSLTPTPSPAAIRPRYSKRTYLHSAHCRKSKERHGGRRHGLSFSKLLFRTSLLIRDSDTLPSCSGQLLPSAHILQRCSRPFSNCLSSQRHQQVKLILRRWYISVSSHQLILSARTVV